MVVNMDEGDKNFLLGWFEKLEKKIDKIEGHQKKTCDELGEVDKKVICFGKDLKNHLDNAKKEESQKLQNQKSSREKKALIISVFSVGAAVVSSIIAFLASV